MPPLTPGDRGNFTRKTPNTSSDFALGATVAMSRSQEYLLMCVAAKVFSVCNQRGSDELVERAYAYQRERPPPLSPRGL